MHLPPNNLDSSLHSVRVFAEGLREEVISIFLLGYDAFNGCRTLFYQNSVPAIWAPYACVLVVDLYFLLTASALISRTSTSFVFYFASATFFIVRSRVRPTLVLGIYVPPAKVCPHLLHFHIPVPILFTFGRAHLVHTCGARMRSSRSATSFLSFLPYLGPNLPADLEILPFLVNFFAIVINSFKSRCSVSLDPNTGAFNIYT